VPPQPRSVDVCVVGGGQAGLAVGYHLHRLHRAGDRRAPSYVVLDDRERPGGAWQDGWDSLELFSPASYSSLPGRTMPPWTGPGNPPAAHVRAYLAAYEERYRLPVHRPVVVTDVRDPEGDRTGPLLVETDRGSWLASVVVNTTGTWRRPFWPAVPGMAQFGGRQLHAVGYRSADAFAGQRVLVVGGGNSGAQIAADLLPVADRVVWVTQRPPRFLPDDVDGRVLFETATRQVAAAARGESVPGVGGLGDIVAVPAVRHARDELGLHAEPMVERLTATGAVWPDGREAAFDSVIWCTGFRPAVRHLRGLDLRRSSGHPVTDPGRPVVSADDPRVLFVGYGDWCGPASATLVGCGRAAREAVAAAVELLAT
jgi:putative flavoprotein involved in K+ transport